MEAVRKQATRCMRAGRLQITNCKMKIENRASQVAVRLGDSDVCGFGDALVGTPPWQLAGRSNHVLNTANVSLTSRILDDESTRKPAVKSEHTKQQPVGPS